jgi:hypothetical protein
VLRALRYDTVLRVMRYIAIRAPGLTILLSLPNYYVTTYLVTLGYRTHPLKVNDIVIPAEN